MDRNRLTFLTTGLSYVNVGEFTHRFEPLRHFMPAKKTTAGYSTKIVTLWQACLAGELNLELNSKGQGTHYRQQMYAYRKLSREEGKMDAVMMDEYSLEVRQMTVNGPWYLIGTISPMTQRINALLDKVLAQGAAAHHTAAQGAAAHRAHQAGAHHNPLTSSPSGIPFAKPEVLPPTAHSFEEATERAKRDMERLFGGKSKGAATND